MNQYTSLLNRAQTVGARLRASVETLNRDSAGQSYAVREAYYGLLESYYLNEVYQRSDARLKEIRNWPGLPKGIRPITSLAKQAVDWWPGQVYPGTWTRDGLPASNGRPNRLPYDADTDDGLRLACQTFYGWGNGNRFLSRLVHTGAMLGDVFAEIEVHWGEDETKHKVYQSLIHPKYVVELELNKRGDVKSYRLAIPQFDEKTQRSYMWGKLVTKESIATFYDDQPHSYVEGQTAEIPNPWGFPAAVWVPHQAVDGDHGASALNGIIPILDEYNGVVSSANDYIHRFVRQGAVVETTDPKGMQRFLRNDRDKVEARSADTDQNSETSARRAVLDAERDRQQINAYPAPTGTRVHHLIQNLGLSEADPHIQRQRVEIEEAVPWVVLASRLQDMDQVTKPGAMALVSQVQEILDEVVGNYDLGVIRLAQMGMSIAGQMIQDGDWGTDLTDQQKMFAQFDMTSFANGDLDFGFEPREILPLSLQEKLANAQMIENLSMAFTLEYSGFSPDEIYGKGKAPKEPLGILEERQQRQVAEAPVPASGAALGTSILDAVNRGIAVP